MPSRPSPESIPPPPNELRRLWPLVPAGVLLVVAAAAAFGVWAHRHARDTAAAALRSVSELRAAQIETLLRGQQRIALFHHTNPTLAALAGRGADELDAASLGELQARLSEYRRANDTHAVLLLDAAGRIVAHEGVGAATLEPAVQQAAQRALAGGGVAPTLVHRSSDPALPMRIDTVAPLAATSSPPRAAVVLRLDGRFALYPLLRGWPVPSGSGASMIWLREGDRFVPLGDPQRDGAEAQALRTAASAMPDAMSASPLEAIDTVDGRGVAVLAVARPLAHSDAMLVTQLDRSEVYRLARVRTAAAAVVAALLVAATFGGWRLLTQRAALRRRDYEARVERERVGTLQLLRSIADHTADAIFAKDIAGRYLFFNRAAAVTLGRPAADMIGRSDAEIFGPAAAAELRANDERAVASGGNIQVEETIPTPGGGNRLVLCTKGPLRDPDGRVYAMFGVGRDVTEQRALQHELESHRHRLEEIVEARTAELQTANAQLAQAEHFVRTVADNLPGRIAYWDTELRCRFANRALYDWFGFGPEHMLGRTPREVFGDEYVAPLMPRLHAALRGEPQTFEHDTVHRGTRYVHLVHYVPDRDRDGAPVRGVFVMAFDVSALKRAEGQLQSLNAELALARDRAEAANRSKSAFLANMSHEIRTPMNAVIGLTHLVLRDTRDALQRERMTKIANAANHLLRVINDILDLSKIEAGRLELENAPFSLDGVVARSFEMVAESARTKGLELIVDTAGVPDSLVGDATRLAQALLNLLSNAVKFTERGHVRLGAAVLARSANRVLVRFSVHDTGPGVAPDRLPLLFQAFEQLDDPARRRHGGTGLGLALTKRLAALMGGEAGAESRVGAVAAAAEPRTDAGAAARPGAGSTFWFTAWLGVVPHAEAAMRPVFAGRRALVVDDLPEALAALADRLRIFGVRADTAADGEAALHLAEQAVRGGGVYDVLVIDWRMQPLDGIATLERLRALLGEAAPPALLVTAYDDDTMRRDAARARFDAVLVKPVTAAVLYETLLQVLQPRTLPVVEEPRRGVAETALRERHAGTRVLLAEDNPINREVALALLRAAGLEADVADDGAEAIEMASRTPYALVLMDMQMPEVDGLEATRELRRRGFAPPIVAMTANAFGEDRAACLAAGMSDHVAKPVDPETLYTTLLRWLAPGATTATDPQRLSARLDRLAGFDAWLALRSAGGDEAALARLLATFVRHYAGGIAALARAGGDERLAAWREAAHSLQAACGAVGAVALHAAAQRLEHLAQRVASAAEIEATARALDAALRDAAAQLAALLGAAD